MQLARLNQALRSLDLDREATVSTQELAPAVDRLLDAFVPGEAGFAADASPEELLIRSAWLIRIMFDGVLGGSRQELNQLIAGLVEARQRPAETFLASYQPFAASPGGDGADVGDPHGVGPLEPAGVFTLEPWHTLGNVLRHDPGSIVPHLQDLAAELRPHMA